MPDELGVLVPAHNPSIWKIKAVRPEVRHICWQGNDFEAILENVKPFVKERMKYKESVCEGHESTPSYQKNSNLIFLYIKDTSEMWVASK